MVVSVRKAPLFVILLEAGVLVVHMQGGGHAFGDDARAKATRRSLRDPALENQLHLFGAAQVQVLADRGFKEQPPG